MGKPRTWNVPEQGSEYLLTDRTMFAWGVGDHRRLFRFLTLCEAEVSSQGIPALLFPEWSPTARYKEKY